MPRPVKLEPALPTTRERIIAAASRLFLDEGYGATGMDAIAKEAGVSKATVYSHYEDKASLFADVMTRMCEEVGGQGEVEGLPGASPEEDLRAILLHGVRRVLEVLQRRIFERVVAECRDFPELGRKFWETGPGRIERNLARYLEEAKRRGALDVDDPGGAAARLVGQLTGLYLVPMLTGVRGRPSEPRIRRDVDDLVAGFLATVRRAAPG